MIYTPVTKLALKTAVKAHEGQTDRCGLPYIFHPYHVAEQMKDEASTAAALLHDVIEDTDMTADDLRSIGFSEDIVRAVVLLTHEDGTDYFDYVRRLKSDPVAKAVKLADLAHNSDMTRLDIVTEKDRERLKKYQKAFEILTDKES
ncbi:MAG: HD domain-containing protein [Huintestinicola sp.]